MKSTERKDFDAQMAILCSAFGVPNTQERADAYWRGLMKMDFHAFVRVVDLLIGNGGPQRMPTAPQVWSALNDARRKIREERSRDENARPKISADVFELYGNRALYSWLWKQPGGVSDASLARLLEIKDRLVGQYRALSEDMPETSLELRDKLFAQWAKEFEPRTAAEKARDADMPRVRRQPQQPMNAES